MTTRRQRHIAQRRRKKNKAQRKRRREKLIRTVANRLLGVGSMTPEYHYIAWDQKMWIRNPSKLGVLTGITP